MTSTETPTLPAQDDGAWKAIGQSIRLRFVEPRSCHWVYEGNPSGEDMAEALGQLQAFALSRPLLLILCDMKHLKEMPPEIRKVARESSGNIVLGAVAILGASFHLRVVTTLIIKGIRLIKRRPIPPVAFLDSEQEGWKWLQKQGENL